MDIIDFINNKSHHELPKLGECMANFPQSKTQPHRFLYHGDSFLLNEVNTFGESIMSNCEVLYLLMQPQFPKIDLT